MQISSVSSGAVPTQSMNTTAASQGTAAIPTQNRQEEAQESTMAKAAELGKGEGIDKMV